MFTQDLVGQCEQVGLSSEDTREPWRVVYREEA